MTQTAIAPTPDQIAARIDKVLDRALGLLTPGQRSSIAEALDLPEFPDKAARASTKRGLLVVLSAAMFHARLDAHLPKLRPEIDARSGDDFSDTAPWPPTKLVDCANDSDPISALKNAWIMILAVDYRPIFETARTVITAPYPDENLKSAIAMIAKEANAASAEAEGLRHDLVGRVFHHVLDTAKFDGSFYTSAAAASLLVGLAVRPETLPKDISKMRVIDPACGTGTLLMATSERIKELLPPPPPESLDVTDYARALIESTITGIDVNVSACHLAATTLGLLSPTTSFARMNIHRALLGPESEHRDANVRLGSLELLANDTLAGMPWSITAQVDTGIDTSIVDLRRNSFDLVIMNPPYTRSSLRHDQFSPDIEIKLKAHEKELMEGTGAHGSGYSSMFTILAEHLLKLQDGAAIAMVYPLVNATNYSSKETRYILGNLFHIEYIVASHDPERFWFSENTNIPEMLIVGRRHSDNPTNYPPTVFVNLTLNPKDPTDAIALASILSDDLRGVKNANIIKWSADRIRKGDWTPAIWLNPILSNSVYEMRQLNWLPDGMANLNNICEIGPTMQRINHNYLKIDTGTRVALWGNNVKHTNTMRPVPDTALQIKPGRSRQADKAWGERGKLMVSRQPWLTTNHVFCVRLDQEAVGCRWIVARPRHTNEIDFELMEKAICVWLNSSPGIAAMLGSGDRQHGASRFILPMDSMRSIPIPKLTAASAEALAEVFDEWADETPRPLAGAVECRVRRALDDAVIATLGADPDAVTAIREALAAEPSVTGKRAQ